jgi:hypothetical protein
MNKLLIFQLIYRSHCNLQSTHSLYPGKTTLDKSLSLSSETTHGNRKVSAVRRKVSLVAAANVSHVADAGDAGVVGEVRSGRAVAADGADAGDTRRGTGTGC